MESIEPNKSTFYYTSRWAKVDGDVQTTLEKKGIYEDEVSLEKLLLKIKMPFSVGGVEYTPLCAEAPLGDHDVPDLLYISENGKILLIELKYNKKKTSDAEWKHTINQTSDRAVRWNEDFIKKTSKYLLGRGRTQKWKIPIDAKAKWDKWLNSNGIKENKKLEDFLKEDKLCLAVVADILPKGIELPSSHFVFCSITLDEYHTNAIIEVIGPKSHLSNSIEDTWNKWKTNHEEHKIQLGIRSKYKRK